MKKSFLTIMAIVGISASAMAASNSNRYFTKGYRADVRISAKAVQYIDLTAGSTNYGITPSLGIDCGRFSVGVGYELRGNRSALQLGLGLNF